MITRYFDEGPWKGLTELNLALTPQENEFLRQIAAHEHGWIAGRQEGGYFKLDLSTYVRESKTMREMKERMLVGIAGHAGVRATVVEQTSDCWMIYYPQDSRIVPHKDPCAPGHRVIRANVCVVAPEVGGEFGVPNGFYKNAQLYVKMRPGQGIVFCPSETEHWVCTVSKGERLVFSVGAIVKDRQ